MFCVVSQLVCDSFGSAFVFIVPILGCARLFKLFVVSLDFLSELGCFGFCQVVSRCAKVRKFVFQCLKMFPSVPIHLKLPSIFV